MKRIAGFFIGCCFAAAQSLFYVDTFPGADVSAKVNACNLAAISAGGGICDASNIKGNQTAVSQINVGGPASPTIVLRLPLNSSAWVWNLKDGISCGVKLFNNAVILGGQAASGGGAVVFQTGSVTTNMDSLLCTDPNPADGGSYVRAFGVSLQNTGMGSLVNGALHVQKLYDQSNFQNIAVGNKKGTACNLDTVTSASEFNNISCNGNDDKGTGGYPLLISNSNAVTISTSTFNSAATGSNNIRIVNSAGITFVGIYLEKHTVSDATTAMIYVDSSSRAISFHGGHANVTAACANSCGQAVFENHGLFGFTVDGFAISNTNIGVNDVADGISFPANGGIAHFGSQHNSSMVSYDHSMGTAALYLANPAASYVLNKSLYYDTDYYIHLRGPSAGPYAYGWKFDNDAGNLGVIYSCCVGTGAVWSIPWTVTSLATSTVLTSELPTCTASTGTPWRASVRDATMPAVGSALTGGGGVFANVHCSLTTGTYLVDGL